MEGCSSVSLESSPLLRHSGVKTPSHFNQRQDIPERQHFHLWGDKHSDDTETERRKTGFKFSRLPRRTKFVLVLCTVAIFLAACAFSILAPFYPLMAEQKGMSLTMIGFVFSVFEMVIIFSSPVFGNYLTEIGPKFVYLSGIFVAGFTIVLFGTLDKSPSGLSFIVISFLVRATTALGCAATTTGSFAIVSSEFPEHIGTVYGILETASAAGFMLGPIIGGALYELGGYGFPFYIMGALVLSNGILIYRFLPRMEYVDSKRKGSILNLLGNPIVFVPMGSILIVGVGIGLTDVTFAKRIAQFGLSTGLIGIIYASCPTMYAISAPLWGYLADSKDFQAILIVLGPFLFGLGFMIAGPSFLLPFLPFEIWSFMLGLAIIGSGSGCVLISTMICMVKGAIELGYENNMDTYALVSGLYTSCHSLGLFLGPLAGGAIVQQYGYPVGYSSVALMSFTCMAVSATFFLFRHWKRRKTNYEKNTVDNITISEEGHLCHQV